MDAKTTAAFVHIPKTGGTTIKFILRNSTFLRHCDLLPLKPHGISTPRDVAFMKKIYFFGLNSIAGHSLRPWLTDDSLSIEFFTMMRDPLQRCLSHYQHVRRSRQRQGGDITFEEFLRTEKFNDCQVRHIAGCADVDKAKQYLRERFFFVGLVERFAESMHVLKKLFVHPLNIEYQPLHVAGDDSTKQEVLESDASREMLLEANRRDMELYAFVRDELYPAFRARAGITDFDTDARPPRPSPWPVRYRLTRWYSHGFYRTANKIRRFINRSGAA